MIKQVIFVLLAITLLILEILKYNRNKNNPLFQETNFWIQFLLIFGFNFLMESSVLVSSLFLVLLIVTAVNNNIATFKGIRINPQRRMPVVLKLTIVEVLTLLAIYNYITNIL